MLHSCALVAFVPTRDLERARSFYEEVLGLTVLDRNPGACVIDAHGTQLRVTLVEQLTPASFTVLGWLVPDIGGGRHRVHEPRRGVPALRRGRPRRPRRLDRARRCPVAWFRDPDGNTLSLTEPPPS